MELHATAGYSATIRCEVENSPGSLGKVLTAIGDMGAQMGAIDLVEAAGKYTVRDLTVLAGSEAHLDIVLQAIRALPNAEVRSWSDRVFLHHLGGKIEIANKLPLNTLPPHK